MNSNSVWDMRDNSKDNVSVTNMIISYNLLLLFSPMMYLNKLIVFN